MGDSSVRAAAPDDAGGIAAVQADAWRASYADLLPAEVLEDLDSPGARDQWRAAITSPPSPRHRVLVALSGADMVGFSAFGPAEDPDAVAMVDAELSALSVRPHRLREGHGSRLVNATVDHLRGDGFLHVRVWLAAPGGADDRLHAFLSGAGWAEDGARRELDLYGDGRLVVPQVRLHAAIGTAA
ncbi:MAG: GNAT family N-acetyltransferase [Sporichthyaceae bacterium]